ncbi:MAG: aldo/keto reductase [Abitibacteriaceae bacterium]|nr:aldo/keto reductase [Abditibacteriaceae bacterium]
MDKLNRREFLGKAVVATGAVAAGSLSVSNLHQASAAPGVKKPTDKVTLGNSGLKISMVGVGTGSIGSGHQSNQTRLGQEVFTQLMRHAFDNGINFFDLADSYGSHPYFARAMQGVPREQYVIQTKTDHRNPQHAKQDIDRFLNELGTEYIDSLIIHCVTEDDWTTKYRGVMDVFEEARQAGKIRAHGVTCHSFGALKAAAASDWVQINQVRWNSKASHMDADVETARALFAQMRQKGQGMIGMKVVGEGDLVRGGNAMSPNECYRFQVESGVVDAFVVGVEKIEHVDQLLHGTQFALNEVGYRLAAAL